MQATFRSSQEIRVSPFDRVSAWLIAGIVMLSVAVLVLATLLTRSEVLPRRIVHPDPSPGTSVVEDGLESDELDPELDTPEVISEVINPSMFEQVSESVSAVQAGLIGKKLSKGSQGVGKRRRQVIPEVVNPSKRWKIAYELNDFEQYSQQLRYFQIEIGVVNRNQNEIFRIEDVGQTNKVVLSNRAAEGKSIYFCSEDKNSQRWDRQLIDDANVSRDDSIVVHLYPQATLDLMAVVELKSIPVEKNVNDIAKTSFRLIRNGSDYEFEVVSIELK